MPTSAFSSFSSPARVVVTRAEVCAIMTESFSLFTPTQVTSAALAESAASASDASEDASAER